MHAMVIQAIQPEFLVKILPAHTAHAKKVPYNVDIKIQFAKRAIAINITVQTAQCTMQSEPREELGIDRDD